MTTTVAAAAAASKMTMVTEADNNDVGNHVNAPVVVARKVPWMMAAIGHGVTSCLCVFFWCVERAQKIRKRVNW